MMMQQQGHLGMGRQRIFLYSHDTYGLGHIRRTLKIANALSSEGASILVATASPKTGSFFTNEGIDFINLPGIIKRPDGSYAPRDIDLTLPELINLRSDILTTSVKSFGPDLILIDKEPLGVGGELLSALDYAKRNFKACKIAVGFRDILDEPERVFKEWRERDTLGILTKYFDYLLVYGEREIFPFEERYQLPVSLLSKMHYLGFVDPGPLQEREEWEDGLDLGRFKKQRPITLMTAGGGGDGDELLIPFLELLESGADFAQNFVLLTGPFADRELTLRARALAQTREDVIVRTFLSEPRTLLQQCERVFCMGGYNTLCEVIAAGHCPYVLGRITPRVEQQLRADCFAAVGWCHSLRPEGFNEARLKSLLLAPAPRLGSLPFKAQGLTRLRELFLGLSSL